MTKSKAYVELTCVIWRIDKGQIHREAGPAVEYANGTKYWFLKDVGYHREDGPAYEYADGSKQWYLNGISYAEEDYNAKIKTLR